MHKKNFLLILLVLTMHSCFCMNYVNELTHNAQEFWNNQTPVFKTAIIALTAGGYVLFNEYRHASKNQQMIALDKSLKNLSQEIKSIKKTINLTNTIINVTTLHLYGLSYKELASSISSQGLIDYQNILQNLVIKFNEKHFKKNAQLDDIIETLVSDHYETLALGLDNAATMLLGQDRKEILYTKPQDQTKENNDTMQLLSNPMLKKSLNKLKKEEEKTNASTLGPVSTAYSYFQNRFEPIELRLKNVEDSLKSNENNEPSKTPKSYQKGASENNSQYCSDFFIKKLAHIEKKLAAMNAAIKRINTVFFKESTFKAQPTKNTSTHDQAAYYEELRDQAWNSIAWNKHKYTVKIAMEVYTCFEKKKAMQEQQNHLLA